MELECAPLFNWVSMVPAPMGSLSLAAALAEAAATASLAFASSTMGFV
jgi:hypothetical protein